MVVGYGMVVGYEIVVGYWMVMHADSSLRSRIGFFVVRFKKQLFAPDS